MDYESKSEPQNIPGHAVEKADLKLILLGDSAVGKSKLVERFLMDDYCPRQDSTYALTLFRHQDDVKDEYGKTKSVSVDIWDTAGQERFQSMHPSYYSRAHVCILVFDVTRKVTYQHLEQWYRELKQSSAQNIPVICIANKIDVDMKVTQKSFKFPKKHSLPFFFVSAADGTNVVKVFKAAMQLAYDYKLNGKHTFIEEVLNLLDEDFAQ